MHINVLNELIECCRQRESDGDCPRQERPSASMLEDALLDLAADNDKLRAMLHRERELIAARLNAVKTATETLREIVSA